MSLYSAPIITSCSSLDNVDKDMQLITITSSASSNVAYPLYVKFIIDNTTLINNLSQITINLKTDDYSYISANYVINTSIPVIANNNYAIKAKVFFSDGNCTSYSALKVFTSNPTAPNILSAYGDGKNSIFLSITPQSEVSSYTAVLGYKDYSSNQQLDVIDNIITTDATKQFIEITGLLQNVVYDISLIATNANGQSKISNAISCTSKPQPDPIRNLSVMFDPDSELYLDWTAPLNSNHLSVTKYRIEINGVITFVDGKSLNYHHDAFQGVNLLYNCTVSAIHSDLTDTNKDSILEYESTRVSSSVFVPEPSEVQNLVALIDPNSLAITLNWSPPANNDILNTYSYDVKYNGLFYQNVLGTAIPFSNNVVPGGTYPFEIIPLHKSQRSTHSRSITVQVPTTGAPVNLTSSYDSSCNIILNWSVPANNSAITASSYNIYDASNTLIVSTSALTYTFSNQVAGQSYSYTVKSLYGSFIGGSSSTTISIPVPAPAVIVASSFDTTGSISLTWNYPQTMVNIDNFAIFDITNNVLSPSIPASPSTANYFFVMGNTYPLGASYSFYILSYNKGVASIASMQTTISLPIPSAPLSLVVVNNPTTPPTASLTWSPPANNNVISSDSYNVYQDGVLVHNVITPSFNTNILVAGQTYSFVVKPLHGTVEYNSPSTVSLTAYQPSSMPVNLSAQPKNNSVLLSWTNPSNIGGLTPNQFILSYENLSGQIVQQGTILYASSGKYSQLITGLTNKTVYNFSLYLTTGTPVLNGQTATIMATPSGSPIVQSISYSSSNKTLSASVDGNGSSLLSNFIIVSYDSSNVPTVNQYTTPIANASGIYTISQILSPSTVKASLVVANATGITSANSWS